MLPRHIARPDSALKNSRWIELNLPELVLDTMAFTAGDFGHLFRALLSEAAGLPVTKTAGDVALVFQRRHTYRRIGGALRRSGLNLSVRRAVFLRDGRRCRYCPRRLTWATYQCDHIVPVSKGGTDDMENLAAACVRCNQTKRARLGWTPR